MFCCKLGHSIQKQILSLWYSKEPVVYQTVYYRNSSIDSDFFPIPQDIVAMTEIKSVSITDTVVKYKIWKDKVEYLSVKELEDVLNEDVVDPWLWIGASTLFKVEDMTSAIQPFVVSGNTITLEMLEKFYPCHYNWKYLDTVTFKEVDFPMDGITIDATRVEVPEEKNEKDEDS